MIHYARLEEGRQGDDNDERASDDQDTREVDKDYVLICCERTLMNVAPRVFLAFVISMTALIICTVCIFTFGDVGTFASIITAIVAFWLPSPLQPTQSRKDAVVSARLLRNNISINRLLATRGHQEYGTTNPNPSSSSPQNSSLN